MTDINNVIYTAALGQWTRLPEEDKLKAYTPIDLGELGQQINAEMAKQSGMEIPPDNKFAALQCRYQAGAIQPTTVRTVQFGLDANGMMVMLWGDLLIPLNYNKQFKILCVGENTLITGTEEDTSSGKRPTFSLNLFIGESETPVELIGSVKFQKELYDKENKRDVTVLQAVQALVKGDTTLIGEIEPGFPTHNLGQGGGNRENIKSTDLKVGDQFVVTGLKEGISKNDKAYSVLEIEMGDEPKSMFSPSEVCSVLGKFVTPFEMEVVEIRESTGKNGKTYQNPVFVYTFTKDKETYSGIIDSRYVPKPYFTIGEITQPTTFDLLGFTYLKGGMFGPQLVGLLALAGKAAVMKLNHSEILTESAELLPGATITVASCTLSEKDNKNRVSSSVDMAYVAYPEPDYSFVM